MGDNVMSDLCDQMCGQMDYETELRNKYSVIWDKKYFSKGQTIWIFQRRTLATACGVAGRLHNEDFDKAATFLFHLCSGSGVARSIVEAVVSQLELAMANPDKFIKGLHQFYRDLTKPIKKNKQYVLYIKALAYLQQSAHDGIIIDGERVRYESLINSAINITLQGMEYLKKQDFDVYNVLAGLSSEDEPIELRDPYSLLDVPAYYLEALLAGHPYDKADSKIPPEKYLEIVGIYYKRFGFPNVRTPDDCTTLARKQQFYNNTVLNMATIINEYTVDMLPEKPMCWCSPVTLRRMPKLNSTKFTVRGIKDALRHRRRTLPANGAVIEFNTLQFIHTVKLKEVCRDDEIICIYKIETADGDLAGYYNTASGWLYSALDGSNAGHLCDYTEEMVLWLYASLVCDLLDILPTDESFRNSFETADGVPTDVRFLTLGGKPRNYLKKESDDESELRVFDKSKYDASSKNINGYIRKLPVGQKASERSIQIAESFGFELHEDETYVMPFVRRQWLKKKNI